jgi:hypothetical protein
MMIYNESSDSTSIRSNPGRQSLLMEPIEELVLGWSLLGERFGTATSIGRPTYFFFNHVLFLSVSYLNMYCQISIRLDYYILINRWKNVCPGTNQVCSSNDTLKGTLK